MIFVNDSDKDYFVVNLNENDELKTPRGTLDKFIIDEFDKKKKKEEDSKIFTSLRKDITTA